MTRKEVERTYPPTLTFSTLEPGTVLEGRYDGCKPIKTRAGRDAMVYKFTDADGKPFEVFGVAALDGKMTAVPTGLHVWLTYHGKVKGGKGTDFHDVRVAYDEETPF